MKWITPRLRADSFHRTITRARNILGSNRLTAHIRTNHSTRQNHILPYSSALHASPTPQTRLSSTKMALTRSTDSLVWIDCEMTGLDTAKDQILSISCFITSADLVLLDEKGYHAIIATPKSVLDAMGEWCQRTHTATGLVEACQSADAVPAEQAASELLHYIKKFIPRPRTALLAGNSVHADKMFLMLQPWTPTVEHLHYRILDVSAIKEGVRRWCSDEFLRQVPVKKGVHSAEEDIRESLAEARYYMSIFKDFGKASAKG